MGSKALQAMTTGSANVAVGANALKTSTNSTDNVAVGYNALTKITLGTQNVAIGTNALADAAFANTGNTAVGAGALWKLTLNSSHNTAIGYLAMSQLGEFNNSTAIGANAQVTGSNMIRLGDTNITHIEGKVQFTAASDQRLKENIAPLSDGSNFIMKLRPVSYRMKNSADTRYNWGFIAQDVEALLGTDNAMLTIGGDSERTLGLRYTDFIAPLVKTVQEQQTTITDLEQKNRELEAKNRELQQAMEREDSKLKAQMANLKAGFDSLLQKVGEIGKRKNAPK